MHQWHLQKCDAHPSFEKIDDTEAFENDIAVRTMIEKTEESKKVARLNGKKYFAVYRKLSDEEFFLKNKKPCIFLLWNNEEA